MDDLTREKLNLAILTLLREAYVGPPEEGKGTWFTDGSPDSGMLGALEKVSAAQASRKPAGKDSDTVAAHVNHVRYALELANRAYRGENAHANADWKGSWALQKVSADEWTALKAALKTEYESLESLIKKGVPLDVPAVLTGTLSLLGHGAWHLGVLWQLLRLESAAKADRAKPKSAPKAKAETKPKKAAKAKRK